MELVDSSSHSSIAKAMMPTDPPTTSPSPTNAICEGVSGSRLRLPPIGTSKVDSELAACHNRIDPSMLPLASR